MTGIKINMPPKVNIVRTAVRDCHICTWFAGNARGDLARSERVMKTATLLSIAIASSALFLSPAHAQLFRAYLAAGGNDANPCTLQAPCRLLPAALNAVADGGEIWMLDSANYNTSEVVITKSVSILAVPGVVGSVLAIDYRAISVVGYGLNVSLRNLVIAPMAGSQGPNQGVEGVSVSQFQFAPNTITIEDSLIRDMIGSGVTVCCTHSLKLLRSTFRHNGAGNNAATAITVISGANATVSSTNVFGYGTGVDVFAFATEGVTSASISDSVISDGFRGVRARAILANTLARVSVTRSTISQTERAMQSSTGAAGTAEVNVGGSLIVDNDYAWYQDGTGSTILSLGNNQMSGNTTSFGTLTTLAPQ